MAQQTSQTLPHGKQSSVLIIGGGTIGLSTALHLSNRCYKGITILERGETIPSAYSAGNDANKIVRADYEDEFYGSLALVRRLSFYFSFLLCKSCLFAQYSLTNLFMVIESNSHLAYITHLLAVLPPHRLPSSILLLRACKSNIAYQPPHRIHFFTP
jgi:hypothetical protein